MKLSEFAECVFEYTWFDLLTASIPRKLIHVVAAVRFPGNLKTDYKTIALSIEETITKYIYSLHIFIILW